MSICRVCHESFVAIGEMERHSFFWFACKPCVKKARTKARWHKRRKKSSGTFSPTDWLVMLLEHEFKCASCNESKPNLTLDHIESIGSGGQNVYGNMQPLCEDCHVIKAREENLERDKRKKESLHIDETITGGRGGVFYCLEIPADIQEKIRNSK